MSEDHSPDDEQPEAEEAEDPEQPEDSEASEDSEQSEAEQPEAEQSDEKPKLKRFRNKFNTARLSPESAERQSRVTMLAWRLLGGRDAAIEFLNNHDDALGGRPLDLAVASVAGCEAVEQAIAARAAKS